MKKTKPSLLILVFLLIYSIHSIGQSVVRQYEDGDYTLEISQWSKNEGFPTWHIYDFIEDNRGGIWIASEIGLIRFDGRDFIIYSGKDSGFRSDMIKRIAKDVNGNIWLFSDVSANYLIDIFDPLAEQAIPVESYIDEVLPRSILYCQGIYKEEGAIWILDPISGKGGRYTGEWEWLLNDTTATNQYDPNKYHVYYPRKDSLFWRWEVAEMDSKLELIDQKGEIVPYFTFQKKGTHFSFIDKHFNHYYYKIPGYFTNKLDLDTLFRFDKEGCKAFSFGEYPSIVWGDIKRLPDDFLKINQNQFGLSVSPEKSFFFKEKEILFESLSELLAIEFKAKIYEAVFIDKTGAFWFASPAGLFRMRINENLFTKYPLENNKIISVRGIQGIGDSQLIINSYTGAFQVDLTDKSFSALPISDRFENLALFKEKNSLWFAKHFRNLIRYDLETQQYEKFPFQFIYDAYDGHDFYPLNDSILWLASRHGILQMNKNTHVFSHFALLDTTLYCWHENAQGIWAGSEFGLIQFDKTGQVQGRFPIIKGSDEKLIIFHIYEDEDSSFWLATDQGVIHWQPITQQYKQYTIEDGLSDNRIHAIYEDNQGYLWLPSNYGLMRFRKKDGYVITYFEKDGLPSNEFNFLAHYQRPDGLLFLGGMNGIISFYPDSISILSQSVPVLQLEKVIVYNRITEGEVNLSKQAVEEGIITIHPNENRLEIKLISHYLSENRIIYEWRLPNEDQKWRLLKEPYLELNNLAYGNYPLEFRAYPSGNKNTSISILQVQMQVERPFYQHWWFRIVLISILLLVIYLFFWWRQRQLLRHNQDLQNEVNHQTKELHDKLITIDQQAKELKLIDEVKSRFFINVSHELRTPLTLILGPVDNLIEQPLTETQQAQLQRIKRNTLHLKQLTEEILDLARLDADKLELHEEEILLLGFVKRVYASYASLARYRGLDYELKLSIPINLRVQMDVLKVERILNNFISNALKFTWEGGEVVLKVTTKNKDICFEVQDTGIGIATADLPRIFDRYYQARHQKDLDNGGLGIGLAMAKELAGFLGGKVWVSSILNKGTTLFFSLPLKTDVKLSQKKERVEITTKPPKETTTALSAKLLDKENQPLLLLVEDNEDLLDYLAQILNTRFRIAQARNGIEALAILKNRQVDMVISDVMMPKMDGFELLKTVRSQPQEGGLSFILLTARSEMSDQLYGLRLGVDAYLSKPFEQKELLARIHNLLENQQKRKTAIKMAMAQKENIKTNENTSVDISFDDHWLFELEGILQQRLKDADLKITQLARDMAMSERSFRTKLKYCTGLKPNQYILQARLQMAYHLLDQKRYATVTEVTYAVGFQSKAYFSKKFKEKFGKQPSELLK